MTDEIYVSTDVEADGPIPGPNSMLSFGSAAYTADKVLVATFSANLETLPDAQSDALRCAGPIMTRRPVPTRRDGRFRGT